MKKNSETKNTPTILIVEDNRINQLLLLKKLEQHGFHSLLLAKNGQEAIALALKDNPDLILMDIQLPDMNGNEAIRHLRNKKFTAPIIAVSADTSSKDMAASSAAGANGYISKPIDFERSFLKLPSSQPPSLIKMIAPRTNAHADKIDPSVSAAAQNVFLMDGREKLEILTAALKHADDEEQMGKIKAIAHEYKGNARYFGLKELESIARELDMGFSNDATSRKSAKVDPAIGCHGHRHHP